MILFFGFTFLIFNIFLLIYRFEDFVVHEIDLKGSMVKLESYDKPEDIILEEEEKEQKIDKTELKIDLKFLDNMRSYSESYSTLPPLLIPVSELDKVDRTKIHAYVRQNFSQLDSKTETIDQITYIKIVANNFDEQSNNPRRQSREKRKGDNRSQKRFRWPKSKPNYVHFVLYKENMETIQVVNELSRRLGCTPKNFTFAGTKDKRAITTQMFSAWKTNPRQIWQVVQEFNRRSRFNTKIHVGHFNYELEQLKLGDLKGNHFEIILRNVRFVNPKEGKDYNKSSHKTIEEELKINVEHSLESVKNIGFINYFGMQRFGSHRVDSHKLGILILKREFKQLVNEILVEKPIDIRSSFNDISFNEAIRIWRESGNAGLAYKKMNFKYTLEGSLLKALTRVDPNDYHGALCIGLLRNSRLLYLHAYQSYLWNKVASFRIREYGLEVVEGDLVFVGNDSSIYLNSEEMSLDDESNLQTALSENDQTTESDQTNYNTMNMRIKANIPNDQVILVKEENRTQFTIYDVVLPIIGGLSKLPQNLTKEFIVSLLQEDDIELKNFASLSKQWCVNGSYRKLLVRPANFMWKWMNYTIDTKPMVKTDIDQIEKKKNQIKPNNDNKFDNDECDHNEISQDQKHRNALLVSFTLPTSSYATVLLREVTKLSSLSLENKPWQQQQQQQQTITTTNNDLTKPSCSSVGNVQLEPSPKQSVLN